MKADLKITGLQEWKLETKQRLESVYRQHEPQHDSGQGSYHSLRNLGENISKFVLIPTVLNAKTYP